MSERYNLLQRYKSQLHKLNQALSRSRSEREIANIKREIREVERAIDYLRARR